MGKGDKSTKRGKIFAGSYGNSRPHGGKKPAAPAVSHAPVKAARPAAGKVPAKAAPRKKT